MPLLVIYNPDCGDRSSEAFFRDHVLPLLTQSSVVPDKVAATESPRHVGTLVADFVSALPESAASQPVSVADAERLDSLHTTGRRCRTPTLAPKVAAGGLHGADRPTDRTDCHRTPARAPAHGRC